MTRRVLRWAAAIITYAALVYAVAFVIGAPA